MNILIVGFGNMGCRHAQSLAKSKRNKFFVIENNAANIEYYSKKVGIDSKELNIIENISTNLSYIDVAIVATPARPRLEISKKLVESGIKHILLEKVVFQSVNQFLEFEKLLGERDSLAYCNFVSRYYPNYVEIKSSIGSGHQVIMTVIGGDFDIGCNALHYIDLFEYLTGSESILVDSSLECTDQLHKRGSEYRELRGKLDFASKNGDRLFISANPLIATGVVVNIYASDSIHILSHTPAIHHQVSTNLQPTKVKEYKVVNTSELTSIIVDDMIGGRCLLPTVSQTRNAHEQLFRAANPVFSITNDLCPIT